MTSFCVVDSKALSFILCFSFCLFYLVINIIRLLGSNVLIYNARSTGAEGAAPVSFIIYSVSF